MQRAYHLLKKFRFTVFCVLLIWYLCLFRPPRIHTFDHIAFFDKWVHMSMYLGTCSVFWVEYLCSHCHWSKVRLSLLAIICPIVMSGVIELAQAYLTTYRSGDWVDFVANSTGVLLALVVLWALKRVRPKWLIK